MYIVSGIETTYATIEEAEDAAKNTASKIGTVFVAEIVGKVSAVVAAPTIAMRDSADKPVATMADAIAAKLGK